MLTKQQPWKFNLCPPKRGKWRHNVDNKQNYAYTIGCGQCQLMNRVSVSLVGSIYNFLDERCLANKLFHYFTHLFVSWFESSWKFWQICMCGCTYNDRSLSFWLPTKSSWIIYLCSIQPQLMPLISFLIFLFTFWTFSST